MEKVSVIIPTMKGRERKLNKLLSTIPEGHEVIIIDDENLLLAAKRNAGASLATGEYLLFIDDDNYLSRNAIDNIIKFYGPRVGIAGMMAFYKSNKFLVADGGSKRNYLTGFTSGVNTNKLDNEIHWASYEVDEVANAFVISKRLFESIGGFDEINFPIDLDEADLCKRIKDAGYKVIMCVPAFCYHDSITYSHIPDFRRPLNAYFMGRNRILYQRKHSKRRDFILYLSIFMPCFVIFYCVSLLYRKKPKMIYYFMKGVIDGVSGRKQNKFQQG